MQPAGCNLCGPMAAFCGCILQLKGIQHAPPVMTPFPFLSPCLTVVQATGSQREDADEKKEETKEKRT